MYFHALILVLCLLGMGITVFCAVALVLPFVYGGIVFTCLFTLGAWASFRV